jgi:hypothetical protein
MRKTKHKIERWGEQKERNIVNTIKKLSKVKFSQVLVTIKMPTGSTS